MTPVNENTIITRQEFGDAYENGGFTRTIFSLGKRGIDISRVEETAQAAWAKAWAHRHELRNRDRLGDWINRIALNMLRDEFERGKRLSQLEDNHDRAIAPDVNGIAIDIDRSLHRCAASQRELFRRRYLDGYSTAEIADGLGISIGAVHRRTSRMLQAVRKNMNLI